MPCHVFSGSCSLCPWCGEEQCPHLHDHDHDKKYWVYATDREESCHVKMANLDTKKEVVSFVKKLVNKRWGKNFKVAQLINTDEIRGHQYKIERTSVPYVELTITDSIYGWYNSVDLLINTEEKAIYYYDKWKTEFSPYINEHQKLHVEIIKPWDEKLEFIPMQELPWYPAEFKNRK